MKNKILIFFCCSVSFTVIADRYSSLELFAQVINVIKKYSFKEVTIDTLVYGAIKGLLREIDSHSQFLNSKQLKVFKDQSSGKFYGLGIEIEKKNKLLTIISVIKNSSSDRAGLKVGDQILKLNQKIMKDVNAGEFSEMLYKNKPPYQMTVLRSESKKPLSFTLKPSRVKMPSIKFQQIETGFYYLRIHYFSKRTVLEVYKKLKDISDIKGLMLDLRSNPGGLLDQAVKIADLFLDQGVIVYYKTGKHSKDQIFYAHFADTLKKFPVVVLIDEYSASASEVLAGALQDHKRALIVGRTSFGKGSIQAVFPIKNKWALKLTIGEYKTPSKKAINNHGIKPDIKIPKTNTNPKSFKTLLDDPEVLQAFPYLKK